MKKYKEFLFENVWEGTKVLDEDGFWKLFNENCSDYDPNILITKYMRTFYENEFFLVDKLKGQNRRSKDEEHGNYYTLLMNNLSSWADYPYREQICALNGYWANPKDAQNFIVIPYNGSKWGVVPSSDIWWAASIGKYTFQYMYNAFLYIGSDERFPEAFKISDKNWETFEKDMKEASSKSYLSSYFAKEFGISDYDMNVFKGDLMKALDREFDPEYLGFHVENYSKLYNHIRHNYLTTGNNDQKSEIWTDQPCLYVNKYLYFEKILPKIKEKTNV